MPPLAPLGFSLERKAQRWELTLPTALESVAIEELGAAVSSLSKQLCALAKSGDDLPGYLLLRLHATSDSVYDTMPLQLQQMVAPGGGEGAAKTEFDMNLIKWLTRWEKLLAGLSTLPLPTVAHLVGEGTVTASALQLAFACDLRVAQPGVSLRFSTRSGLLPGTLTFRIAKHVGAGRAMTALALDESLTAQAAHAIGAVQRVAPSFEEVLTPPQGAMLLLCRSLLIDGVWLFSTAQLQERLLVWQDRPDSVDDTEPVTPGQLDALSQL